MSLRRLACLGAVAVLAWSQNPRDEAALAIQKLLADGQAPQAEAAARNSLANLDRQNPGGTLETARVLDLLAAALEAQAAGVAPVKAVVDRAIAIKSEILGPGHSSIAASLATLGRQQAGSGDYAGAVATLERAYSLQEKVLAAPIAERVLVQDALGSALTDAGQYARAKQMLERALALNETGSGPESRSAGEILRHLGVNGWQSGDMPRAKVYLERAVAIFERTLGPDHLSTGNAVGDLASVVKLTGNYAEAKPLFERSLRIYELRLGLDHPRLAVPLNNLALCVKELDEFEEARNLLQRALEILEKRLGPDNSRTATVLQNLGIVYREMGDFTHSRQAYERALGIQERRLGPDHPLMAAVSNSLGELLNDLGDAAAAKPHLARALAIYQQRTAADNPKIPEVMQSLAGVLRQTRDRLGARQLLERAVAAYTQALSPENPKLVSPLLDLGEILFEVGDLAGAQARYDRALAIQQKAVGRDSRGTAAALDHLATLAAARRNYKQAAQLERESIHIWSKTLGEHNTYTAEPLARLAQALGHLGQGAEALRAALDSAQIRREHLRLTVRALPERQALLFAAGGNGGLDAALGLVAARPSAPDADVRAVWDELIRDRALVLDEMAARHRAAYASAGAPLVEGLRKAREHFARLVVSGADSKAGDTYEARWQHAREAVDSAEEALAAAVSDDRRARNFNGSGYAEMAAELPPHSALVAFARYRQEPWVDSRAHSEPFYLAFVLKAGTREPVLVRLGSAASVEARVADWRREIHREAESMGRNAHWNEQEYRKAGMALRKAVWDPLDLPLRGATSIFVVPDGALQLVNLGTLPWGETGYLADQGPLLHTLSAERDLVDAPHPRSTGGLLALGNPSYQSAPLSHQSARRGGTTFRGAHSRCADFTSLRFQPLPASAGEVRAILGIWNAQGEAAMLLSGADASEAGFKQNAAGKRVLHLATHGFFLDGECRADSAMAENPLLRAGLALAGANRRQAAATDEDDGILTAEEVASLNLEGAEWVVLSGCDTGEGEVRAGEGVLGLRRAFRIAGADTLIASLWPVEDEATRQWMTALYQSHFGQGRSTVEAVANATAKQLRARRAKGLSTHPFYWGSFVAVGNWR